MEKNIEMTRKEMEEPTEVETELKRRLQQLTDHLILKQAQVFPKPLFNQVNFNHSNNIVYLLLGYLDIMTRFELCIIACSSNKNDATMI